MINATGLEVILTLDDKLSAGFSKALGTVKKEVDKASQSIGDFGRTMQQTGRNLTFLGTAITGPLAIAFKTASNYSIEVSDTMKRMNTAAIDFQTTIATAMLPVVEKLTRMIENLNKWFKDMDKGMRDAIIQAALLAGIFLLIIGPLTSVIGRLARLAQVIIQFAAANVPLVVMVGALVALIYYWEEARRIIIPIINGIQIALDMLAIGYEKVALAMVHMLAFAAAMAGKQDLAVYFEEQAIKIEETIRNLESHMTQAMSGEGWGNAVDQGVQNLKTKWEELVSFFTGDAIPKINSSLAEMGQNFDKTFTAAYNNAVNIGQQSANILISQINMFSSRFGQAFGEMVMHGKNFGDAMKQLFHDMLEMLISTIVQMLIQWALYEAAKWAMTAASIAMAKTIELAWAGAAAMVSLAMAGANAIGAMAGITATYGLSHGLAMAAEGGVLARGGGVLVGERGPEILDLPTGARITPLDKKGAGVTVYMENAYFRTEDEAEDTLSRLSRLVEEKRRSRI